MKTSKVTWYKRFVGECPVCGRDQSYKKAQHTPKPTKASDRVEAIDNAETYDWCNI